MLDRSPLWYIPRSIQIGQPVPEKKFFKGFTIYGRGSHLGYVTSIMSSNFHFLVPESFHRKIASERHSNFLENLVSILYVHDLGPRSRNYLYLQYSHSFINPIRCLLLPTFRSMAAIVSERFTVFTFSCGKAQITKFDLVVKQIKVNQG